MAAKPKQKKYSWSQFQKDSIKIAVWAKRYNFKNVYGVPRGGLIPAVTLSHLLDIPLILSQSDISRDTLIVDDIVDKGTTIQRLFSTLGGKHFIASLFFNPESSYTPQFFVREKKYWVIFPWETRATSRYDRTV